MWAVVILVVDFFFIGEVGTLGWLIDGIVMIIILTFLAFFSFWTGLKGIKGANAPSKANSCIAGALILSLVLVICIIFFILAFIDAGQQAIDGDLPLFILIVAGLILSLLCWNKAKAIFEASKDAI